MRAMPTDPHAPRRERAQQGAPVAIELKPSGEATLRTASPATPTLRTASTEGWGLAPGARGCREAPMGAADGGLWGGRGREGGAPWYLFGQ